MTYYDKVNNTSERNALKWNCVDVIFRYIINEIRGLCVPTFYCGFPRLKNPAEFCLSPSPAVVADSISVGRWKGEYATQHMTNCETNNLIAGIVDELKEEQTSKTQTNCLTTGTEM